MKILLMFLCLFYTGSLLSQQRVNIVDDYGNITGYYQESGGQWHLYNPYGTYIKSVKKSNNLTPLNTNQITNIQQNNLNRQLEYEKLKLEKEKLELERMKLNGQYQTNQNQSRLNNYKPNNNKKSKYIKKLEKEEKKIKKYNKAKLEKELNDKRDAKNGLEQSERVIEKENLKIKFKRKLRYPPSFKIPLRDKPSLGGNTIYKCPKESTFFILEYGDPYHKVLVDGYIGFFPRKWINM